MEYEYQEQQDALNSYDYQKADIEAGLYNPTGRLMESSFRDDNEDDE